MQSSMRHVPFLSLAAITLAAVTTCSFAAEAPVKRNPLTAVFGNDLRLVDVIDCTKTDWHFVEFPAGASKVETILGKQCRVMPVQPSDSSFFSYRIGENKGLKPNGAYVIVLEYPDDLPRNYIIHNRAIGSKRSFYTGTSIGDSWNAKYVDSHPESLNIPQTGKYQWWTCYSSLHDRTSNYKEAGVEVKDANGNVVKNNKGEPKKQSAHSAADGFDFIIAQYGREHDPNTAGIAVSRIMLYEIPDETKCYAKLVLPPAPLPQRHLFWREEMSDNGTIQGDYPECANRIDWFEQKARQMKILGMNTYMKDLLEFGHVQHWNPHVIRPNWAWGAGDEIDGMWERIVNLMAKYNFSILPYYEWYGNLGADYNGRPSFGPQRRAETLGGGKNYTHIWWSEKANLDITDPESLVATQELLQGSLLRFKDKAKFIGAMFRTRPASWPVSFADATRRRFSDEKKNGAQISRDDLKRNRALYDEYLRWWEKKRAAFLDEIQKYLAKNGLPNAMVIFDADTSEPGPGFSGGGFTVDDKDAWTKIFADLGWKPPKMVTTKETVDSHLFLKNRHTPVGTWGNWEWQHACPCDDPENYSGINPSVWLALPINRLYSVADPEVLDAYRNASGTETIIRHYPLNENMVYRKTQDGKEERLIGYAIHDSERAGRACMQNEVMAMATGNPKNIGYLVGSNFARGFPGPVREFNQNFLALPALPSKIIKGACADPEVVLREIDAGAQGKYFALVHTGDHAKKGLQIKFPEGTGKIVVITNGKTVPVKNGVLTTGMDSWQLIALKEVR